MTEPKRWSDPRSDVDPVLSSVLRYGAQLGPDSSQLQRLLEASAPDSAQATPPRVRSRRPRRVAAVLGFGLAAAFGGVAWAHHVGLLQLEPASPLPAPAPAAASSAAPSMRPASTPRVEPAAPSVPSAEPISPPRAAPAPAPRGSSAAPVVSAEEDATLLQQARSAVASNPARALMLTRDHEVRFADSPLVEERQALRIEALFRLGRREEALRALGAFEASFPRSPYRRRLQTLGQ